jgi:hypothetical protein
VNATFAKADQPSIFSPQAAAADTSSHSLSYSKLDNIKQTTSSAKPQSSSKKDMSLDLQ